MPLNYSPSPVSRVDRLTPSRTTIRTATLNPNCLPDNWTPDRRITLAFVMWMLIGFALTVSGVAKSHAQSSTESQSVTRLFAKLPESTVADIEAKCLPEQYRNGASAYRDCVESEVNQRTAAKPAPASNPAPVTRVAREDDQVIARRFDALAHDDKYAIQRSCQRYLGSDGRAYSDCVAEELSLLGRVSAPIMTDLSSDEQFAVRQSCFSAQTNDGAAAYRRCLNQEIADLSQIPPVSMAGLTSVETTSLQLECSPSSKNQRAAEYRICLAQSLERLLKSKRDQRTSDGNQETVVAIKPQEIKPVAVGDDGAPLQNNSDTASNNQPAQPDTTEDTTVVVAQLSPETDTSDQLNSLVNSSLANSTDQPAPEVRIIPKPEGLDFGDTVAGTDQTLDTGETTSESPRIVDGTSGNRVSVATIPASNVTAQQSSTTADAPADAAEAESSAMSPAQLFDKLKTFDIGSYLGDHPAASYARYASLLLPAIFLWALYRFLSLFGRSRRRTDEEQPKPRAQVDDPLFDDLPNRSETAQFDQTAEVSGIAGANPTSRLSDRVRPDMSRQAVQSQLEPDIALDGSAEASRGQTRADNQLPPIYDEPTGEFGQWLATHNDAEQKKFCIEFLLYWVTYGEGKYDPELKAAILEATELNDHDVIKKHIFLKDIDALISTLRTTREKFNASELSQILNLMFAVLVEHTVSPTQNIFFRFFADFAGIGADGLSKKYQQSFGAPLPPVPRPDDARWWAKRKELEEMKPQVARTERDVMMTRLGLKEPVDSNDVQLAYQHIQNRFAEDNFDLLGDKEQKLVRRHLINYAHARDYLLEDLS